MAVSEVAYLTLAEFARGDFVCESQIASVVRMVESRYRLRLDQDAFNQICGIVRDALPEIRRRKMRSYQLSG